MFFGTILELATKVVSDAFAALRGHWAARHTCNRIVWASHGSSIKWVLLAQPSDWNVGWLFTWLAIYDLNSILAVVWGLSFPHGEPLSLFVEVVGRWLEAIRNTLDILINALAICSRRVGQQVQQVLGFLLSTWLGMHISSWSLKTLNSAQRCRKSIIFHVHRVWARYVVYILQVFIQNSFHATKGFDIVRHALILHLQSFEIFISHRHNSWSLLFLLWNLSHDVSSLLQLETDLII